MGSSTKERRESRTQDRKVLMWNYACYLLGRYIYSEKKLREKLKKRYPENLDLINFTIEKLKDYGYLNDKRNEEFLKDKLKAKGYGPTYIRQWLLKKGFQYVPNDEKYSEEALEKWYKKKMGEKKLQDKKDFSRVYNYLLSKGFHSEDIIDFLRKRGSYDR